MHFLNIDEDFALRLLGELAFELFDLGALATDDDTRTRSPDRDPQFVARTIHFDGADPGLLETAHQRLFELNILKEQLSVIVLGEPP